MKRIIKLYFTHLKYYASFAPLEFFAVLILGVISYVFYPLKILVRAKSVDSIVEYYSTPTFIRLLDLTIPYPLIFVGGWLMLIIAKEIVNILKTTIDHSLRNKVYFSFINKDLVPKIHDLNLKELEKNSLYNKLETFKLYWWNNATNVLYQTIDLIGALVSLIITFLTIQKIPLWAIIIATGLPVIYVVAKFVDDKRYREFVEKKALLLRKRSYFINVLTDIRTFMERKVNAVYQYLNKLLQQTENRLKKAYIKFMTHKELNTGFWKLYDMILLSILQFYVASLGLIKHLKVGVIWANVTYIANFYNKSQLFMATGVNLVNSLRYVKDLYDIYEMKGFAAAHSGHIKVKQTSTPPLLTIKNLNFKFSERSGYVFKDFNLTVKPGEKVLILGEDGSGKTALVKILTALFPVPHNTYFINNVPAEKYERFQIKNLFSIVPEDFSRYYLPLKTNIILGDPLKHFDKKLYELALLITGLDKWIKQENIDPTKIPLGTYFYPGYEISSGHWQRIAIARAIYRNRPIFVLDQPFTYIDDASSNYIFKKLIEFINKTGKTLIYIGEDVKSAHYFDSIYEKFKDGTIARVRDLKKKWKLR